MHGYYASLLLKRVKFSPIFFLRRGEGGMACVLANQLLRSSLVYLDNLVIVIILLVFLYGHGSRSSHDFDSNSVASRLKC